MADILKDWAKDDIVILVRDKFKCVYCGLDGTKDVNAFRQLILCFDHLVPRSRYLGEGIENRVTCCWACNRAKSDWDPRDEASEKAISDADELRLSRIKRVQDYLKGRHKDELSDYYANCLHALKEVAGSEVAGTIARLSAEMERTSAGLDAISDHDAAITALDRMTALNKDLVQAKAKTIEDLCAKAKATAWAIEYEYGLLDPTKESSDNNRLAASIVRDLLEIRDAGREGTSHSQRD